MIRIGHATVEVLTGRIEQEETDAVVCPANDYLWMGSGVAAALKKGGGEPIETEAVAQGPVEVGTAVITTGGTLKARHVIHAATVGQDLKPEPDAVATATRNSLLLAEQHGLRSVSIPDLAAGGLEVHLTAKTMIDTTIDHLVQSDRLERLRFVLDSDETFQAFHDHLLHRFSAGP